MNYRKYLLPLCILITAISCEKKASTTNQNPEPEPVANFSVNGIKDIITPSNSETSIDLEVKHEGGTQETVSLTLEGLPAKVTSDFSAPSGIPTYSTTLTITPDYAAEGTYPLVLTAKSLNGSSETFDFNLVIESYTDCAEIIAGEYAGFKTCSNSGSQPVNFKIQKDNTRPNGILLVYYDEFDNVVPATVNCDDKTIEIPFYTKSEPVINGGPIGTYEVSGSGTYTGTNAVELTLKKKYKLEEDVLRDEACNYKLAR